MVDSGELAGMDAVRGLNDLARALRVTHTHIHHHKHTSAPAGEPGPDVDRNSPGEHVADALENIKDSV